MGKGTRLAVRSTRASATRVVLGVTPGGFFLCGHYQFVLALRPRGEGGEAPAFDIIGAILLACVRLLRLMCCMDLIYVLVW